MIEFECLLNYYYRRPWILVKRVASGAARGMNYLHCGSPPVLHRDLKSANILLDDSYNAKVADFGLSRLKAQERSMTGNCGTVQWMAPEVRTSETKCFWLFTISFSYIFVDVTFLTFDLIIIIIFITTHRFFQINHMQNRLMFTVMVSPM